MSGGVDVLSLKARGRASLDENGGAVVLKAGDAVSAMQAIVRQANLKVDLTPEEVERLTGAGCFRIALTYPNDLAGATAAVKQVDQLAGAALAARQAGGRPPWRVAAFLLLLAVLAALAFVATVALLGSVYGAAMPWPP